MSVTNEDIRVKFHRQIEYRDHYRKSAKLGQRGSWSGHVTYFSNFGTPSISSENVKLEASNLTTRVTNEKSKIRSKGLGRGRV